MSDTIADNQIRTEGIKVESQIKDLPAFKDILFSNCWEDTDTENAALQITPDDTVISITASGGRTLNLLQGSPKRLISVDLNFSQNFLLELKAASIKAFDNYDEFAQFLGLREAQEDRLNLYNKVKPLLSEGAQHFWGQKKGQRHIKRGFLNAGRQDTLINRVRPLFSLIVPKRKTRPLFEFDSLEQQRAYFDKTFNTKFYHTIIKILFSKVSIRLLYRKDLYESTKHLDMGDMLYTCVRDHANNRLIKENYFLSNILLGKYVNPDEYNSYYLRPENFNDVKERVNALEIVTAPLEDVLHGFGENSIDKFSLSDIFDWITEENFQHLMNEIVRVGKNQSRMCYRICLIDRYPSEEVQSHLKPEQDLADRLFKLDRSCFYKGLWVGTITK